MLKPNSILSEKLPKLLKIALLSIGAVLLCWSFFGEVQSSQAADNAFTSPISPPRPTVVFIGTVTPIVEETLPPPFDFTKDLDFNGFPDEFEVAAERYLQVTTNPANANNETVLGNERSTFRLRIPYSVQSRQVFAEIERVTQQLKTTKSDVKSVELNNTLNLLLQQLAQDPVYSLTNRYFEMRLRAQIEEKTQRDLASASTLADTPSTRPSPTTTPHTTDANSTAEMAAAQANNTSSDLILVHSLYLPVISTGKMSIKTQYAESDDQNDVQASAVGAKLMYLPWIGAIRVVDFSQLQRGDLLFRNGKTDGYTFTNYALIFSHNGFYDGDLRTYESNWDIGGVRLQPLTTWQKPIHTALVRATGKNVSGVALTPTIVQGALDWSKNKWGIDRTPYNFNVLDKNREDALYCSQLVWKTFGYIQTEVDSESSLVEAFLIERFGSAGKVIADSGVLPDEVYLDDNMSTYDAGLGARETGGSF